MAVRHDVVILEPEALKGGVLLTLILVVPGDCVRMELSGDLADLGINDWNAAVTAPISVAGEDALP